MTGLVSMMTSEYSSIRNFSAADGTVDAFRKNTLSGRKEGEGKDFPFLIHSLHNTHTVEDKKTFPFGISRTMLFRGVSLTFYVNGRLKTVIERS